MSEAWPELAVRIVEENYADGRSGTKVARMLNEHPQIPRNDYTRCAVVAKADRDGIRKKSSISDSKISLNHSTKFSHEDSPFNKDRIRGLEESFFGRELTVGNTSFYLFDEEGNPQFDSYGPVFKRMEKELEKMADESPYVAVKNITSAYPLLSPRFHATNMRRVIEAERITGNLGRGRSPLSALAYVSRAYNKMLKWEGKKNGEGIISKGICNQVVDSLDGLLDNLPVQHWPYCYKDL